MSNDIQNITSAVNVIKTAIPTYQRNYTWVDNREVTFEKSAVYGNSFVAMNELKTLVLSDRHDN